MTFGLALCVDIALLVAVTWFVLRISGRSIYNPAFLWIGLHVYAVTCRLAALTGGFPLSRFTGILSESEVISAVIADDFALVAVAIAVGFATAKFSARNEPSSYAIKLNPFVGSVLSFFCLTVGTVFLLYFARTARANAGDSTGELATTSYPLWIAEFALQGAVIRCAIRGFTKFNVALLLAMAVLTSMTLYARAMFILPLLMSILVFHLVKGREWFNLRWVVVLLALGFVWYVFRPFARPILAGQGVSAGLDSVQNQLIESSFIGEGDAVILDQQATYMGAADDVGKRFYGSTVLPLIYLPIPRYLWPDKPSVAQFAIDITHAGRPIAANGMVALLAGESYLNFGWAGCLGIPFLYMLLMMYGYYRTRNTDIDSAPRWFYLVMLVAMVQVYRDGLNSIVLFGFLHLFPLVSWSLLSVAAASFAAHHDIYRRAPTRVPAPLSR